MKEYKTSETIRQWGEWEIDAVPQIDVKKLLQSRIKYDEQNRCTNIFEILSDPEVLMIAYEMIKSNSGNMVRGVDYETLDGITKKWFTDTSSSLIKESYKFRPVRRVYIPKANGKLRPLGVGSPRDKIIQQATRIVLEHVLEPRFSKYSHGFRPSRGCHTALREIRKWKGVAWFIEGDIKGFFDNIDHHILEKLLKKHIKDARFIHLYWKFVKAGYVEYSNGNIETFIDSKTGVPQGGILSPLLSNLVLHELDEYIEKYKMNDNTRNRNERYYKKNPKYHMYTMRIDRLKKRIDRVTETEERKICLKRLKQLKVLRRRIKSIVPTGKVNFIEYVRYADDWIIGVWGTKCLANKIKNEISLFLKDLKLTLSLEKTLVTNARNERAIFLGTQIKRMASSIGDMKVKNDRKLPSGNLLMNAPIPKLVNKMVDKGFLTIKNGKWKPKSIATFIPLEDSDIILRFNTIIRGILNYYSFVDNRQKLTKLSFIIKECLRKTLSRKHKLNKTQFISKYSKMIAVTRRNSIEVKRIWFYEPKLIKEPMNFLGSKEYNNVDFDPFKAIKWRVSTKTNFDFPCAVCGDENTEMHHIKHIKTLNVKLSSFDSAMAKVNRKQVPLCRPCHLKVHKGEYVGSPLKFWKPINQLKVKLFED
uniref:Reverse transcriptase domain-containing protein n=1 Tax=Calonectria ilicicola TaxID=182845 RepID=A0A6G7MXR1_9HYPO|nr:hypothetical protein [Calonectria ilicicola]